MNKVFFVNVNGVLNNGTWSIEMFDKGKLEYVAFSRAKCLLYQEIGSLETAGVKASGHTKAN